MMVYVFILLSSFITIYRPWKAHIYNISVYRKSEVEKHFDNIRQLCFIRKNLTLWLCRIILEALFMSHRLHFDRLPNALASLHAWRRCGSAAEVRNCRNTVCCCTVPVVDFEGRYRFGCLSTAKSVKEGIIERDFPPTSKIIEYIYCIYIYIDVFILMQLPIGNHYWFASLPNVQDTLVEVICDINLYSSAQHEPHIRF